MTKEAVDPRQALGTSVVRRKLKTGDFWHMVKILKRVRAETREAILEQGGEVSNDDLLFLLLEGADTAREEIHAWFSDLTGIPAEQIEDADITLYNDILDDLEKVGLKDFFERLASFSQRAFGTGTKGSG